MGLFDRLMQPQAPSRLDEFYPPDYSKLKRGQFRQDTPQMREYAANVPVDVARGTFAGLFGLTSDILNFAPAYSPMPMEQFGDYNYAPSQKVPYGSEYFLENLPLAPAADNPLGTVAGQLGSFAPMVPVQAARIAGKGAAATGRFVAPKAGQLAEGYMQRMGMMPSVVPAEGGLLTPSVKPQAPVSQLGFYSAAEQAALNLQRNKGTGQSFINDLMKAPDVKKEELAWTGLDEFLANKPNVTKQEVQDFLAGNRVDLQERQLSGRGDKFGVFSEFNPDKNQFMVYGEDLSHTHAFDTAEEADNFVKQFNSQIPYGPSKYDKYQLPGGDNYREILLTTPVRGKSELDAAQISAGDLNRQTADLMEQWKSASELNPGDPSVVALYQKVADSRRLRDQAETKAQELKNQIGSQTYQSSHFNEPNILAHIRVNDRVDADGKKMLLIEELQSDWHQAGREKGYKGQLKDLPNDYKVQSKTDKDGYAYYEVLDPQGNVFAKDYSKGSVTNQAINRLNETVGGVPDAPFKDTWHQLALKRALKYAADNGYERVGLTTGAQQAKRYDLSKQVDEIAVPMVNADGSRSVRIEPTEGGNIKLMVDSNGRSSKRQVLRT